MLSRETKIVRPVWPEELPLAPLLDSYAETFMSLTKAVTASNKSVLSRRVGTRNQQRISVNFSFTRDQVELFEKFYYDTLEGGAMIFTFQHPRRLDAVETTFDSTQETAFTIKPNGSMKYFTCDCKFLIWD